MKRMMCGLLAALCLLACGACSRPEGEAAFPAAETTQALLNSGAFSEQLERLDYDIAAMLFGFDSWCEDLSLLEASEIYYSTGATSELCAVLVLGEQYEEKTVTAALASLEAWLEYQIEAERDYRPAEVVKLENAVLEARANSILLVVAADAAKARETIQ